MTDPTIRCPTCNTEIKLTESLAAPLIAATRKEYEQKFAEKEVEYGNRETKLMREQQSLAKAS